jgi:hypothetical protein
MISYMKSYMILNMFHVWYHIWYHKLYDIIHDIIVFKLISYMISSVISLKKQWYHIWYHSSAFLALLWYCQNHMISYMISYFFYDIIPFLTISYRFLPFLRYHHAISNTISYTFHRVSALISVSYDKSHDIRAYNPWNGPLISVTSDITAMWYHGFHDMFAYIMAPARRDGAGWGRQLPAAPPPPASPSPTCWGRVFSWTPTEWSGHGLVAVDAAKVLQASERKETNWM